MSLWVVIDGEAKQALVHGDHPQCVLARGDWLDVTRDMVPINIKHKPTRSSSIISELTVAGVTVAHVAEGVLAFEHDISQMSGKEHHRVRVFLATGRFVL